MLATIGQVGAVGVNRDASPHELPPNVWTHALNIRFDDGVAYQTLGHLSVMGTPSVVPYHIMPLTVSGATHWLYAGANKIYDVTGSTHTNITRQTAGVDVNYTAARNEWTSCMIGGIPVLNNGTDAPQEWLLTGKCTALSNWPANTTCASMRAYRNFLIALDITKSGNRYPYMVKWSNRAEPGSVPSTWDETDETDDAGEFDLSEGHDYIIDGLALRDSFMIYRRNSIWRMDETGDVYVFRFSKVMGTSGALNRNCISEIDGFHFVLTNEDVILHDGQQSKSILNTVARRFLFSDIDSTSSDVAFVFKNPYYNEMYVCYPSQGSSVCDKALVWNWETKAVSFRDMPNINHAAPGPVDVSTAGVTWSTVTSTWAASTRTWDNPGATIDSTRTLMASNDTKLFVLDETFAFDGTAIDAVLQRQSLPLGDDDRQKILRGVKPRITGEDGGTVLVYLGGADDPYEAPTFGTAITYTIGTTTWAHGFYQSRYPAVKFETGTATNWRLDSYQIDFVNGGKA